MEHVRTLQFISASLLFVTSSYATAAVIATSCNGCTDNQIAIRAQAKGRGLHYIYDLPRNQMHLLKVECEPDGKGGTECFPGEELSVAADVKSVFDDYHALYLSNGASEIYDGTVHVDIASGNPVLPTGSHTDNGWINAYDTLHASALEKKIIDYLNDPAHWTGATAIVVQAAQIVQSNVVNFAGASLVVKVVYSDGSERRYKYSTTTHTFEPLPNSANDAHGNSLVELPPRRDDSYIYNGGSAGNGPDGYDHKNAFWDLEHSAPTTPYCIQETWDGERLNCVRAR
jgi:hypothetical protein